MSRLSFEKALQRGQENAVNALSLVQKTKIADAYFKTVDEECRNFHDKGVVASMLNNFHKVMDSDLGKAISTSTDFGPYVPEVWPLVTAWYLDFPLKDLISVQDMDKPLAYLFFSLLKTGTTKSDTVVGDVVETATGQRTIRGRYPTGEIFGETLTSEDFDYDSDSATTRALLAYAPLNVAVTPGYLGKIKLTITTASGVTEYRYLSISGTTVHLAATTTPTTDSGITIDVETGLISYPETTGATTVTQIVANYVWNVEYGNLDNLPKVKEQVEMRPMEAVPRALMLEWTIFAEYLKKTQFGEDIRKDNLNRMLSLLYQYQVRYILDEMYDYAEGNNGNTFSVSIPSSSAISLDVKAQTVLQSLKEAANIIELASGRIEGNRIVCGRNFKTFVESLPENWFKKSPNADSYGFSTPRHIGTFSTFEVYYDPMREANEGFMTYRGKEFYDAAYYLGTYLPIVPTDAVSLGVTVRSSFVSMEAYRYDKPTCTVKLDVDNA